MLIEKQINLFDEIKVEPSIILHCISSDLAMGAGIAKSLQNKFHIRESWSTFNLSNLSWNLVGNGYCVFTDTNNQVIGNLVTKELYWQKPTYQTLESALMHARKSIDVFDRPKIVMPRIGCGLDRLDWNKVRCMVESIFNEYTIVVCYI